MNVKEFIVIVLSVIMASCSVHMQIPGKPGKHPNGKIIIHVPSDDPELRPIPDRVFPHIH